MSGSNEFSQLAFPDKLWYLVNDSKCDQIDWGPEGLSIVIIDAQEFSKKVLNNPSKAYFKTKNLASFIRQLNLYGFRKVSDHKRVGDSQYDGNRCEFKHPCFRKDRKDLLEEVRRHQNNNKKEESPSEEKPGIPPNNIPPYPSYFPNHSMSSPLAMWANWDAYIQAMGLFPYLPPMGVQGAFAGMQAPGYCSREAMEPPYGGFLPQYYQMPQRGYNDMSMLDTSGVDTRLNETKSIDSSSVTMPTLKVTPSKPSVFIINNTLSSARDVPTENGCYGKRGVSNVTKDGSDTTPDVYMCRGQEGAKKPIPAQRAEVGSSEKAVSYHNWRLENSVGPVRYNYIKNKATEEKPVEDDKQHNAKGDKETDGVFQRHDSKKVRLGLN